MAKVNFEFNHDHHTNEKLCASIEGILESNDLCSMATISGRKSYINTAYYSFNKNLEIFFISEPFTQHIKNLEKNNSMSIAVWNQSKEYGENLQGLQLFGKCARARGVKQLEALKNYSSRFHPFGQLIKHPDDFAKNLTQSRLYYMTTERIKILDEILFDRREYISLSIP